MRIIVPVSQLESYIFQYCPHTFALRVQCEQITEIYNVLCFPFIALTHRLIASRLCEAAFIQHSQVDITNNV